ncbi:amidohydrolase [Pedobacter yulinensis]|uniref:Amidohydrolase n=1 Tax=Pedobacter yulinensis TaxID=2126353 RepID=A0A2T3HKY5_9SPHI|nr:amidohydrolase family protein [Pedobacter yulinensis]PST83073.1 amidohydrolase [Pedobacter yulinensis]
MIDSHVHFWNYDPRRDAWITPDMQAIRQDFLPAQFEQVNPGAGCVAVQASQTDLETGFLLQLASDNPTIQGVVGWTDLRAPNVEDTLAQYKTLALLKGFRHIVQAEPEGFLAQPDFIRGIHALGRAGFRYDILVFSQQLTEVAAFLEACPPQPFVLDHCAKPAIASGRIDDWTADIQRIARHPNVSCKVSGLLTEANWQNWSAKEIYPYLDVVFSAFGIERLLFGSDWPLVQLAGGYRAWLNLLSAYLDGFSEAEKTAFFGGNAARFYTLS